MSDATRNTLFRSGLAALALLGAAPAASLAREGGGAGGEQEFVRGDADRDGRVTLMDPFFLLDALFAGIGEIRCGDAADVNDDGTLGISDATLLLEWIFGEGRPPPPPFPAPGRDPTPDGLGCDDPQVRPPVSEPGFAFAWDGPASVRAGERDVELFLAAATATPIGCFTLAYRADLRVVANIRADFQGTLLSPEERPFFKAELLPHPDPALALLRVQALFRGPDNQVIPFPATERPLAGEPLLRLLVDMRADAPRGPGGQQAVLVPALLEDLDPLRPAGLNEFCAGDRAVLVREAAPLLLGIEPAPVFVRGDANLSGRVSPVDVNFILEALFLGGPFFRCLDAADVNDDGLVDVQDASFLLRFVFAGGAPPPPPFPHPGEDPTKDDIGCDDPEVTPPPADPRYRLAWSSGSPDEPHQGEKDFELYLLATTAAPIECFSIAYRVDRLVARNLRADFANTLFPAEKREAFEASPFFGYQLTTLDERFDRLQVGATFVEVFDGGFRAIDFEATRRPLEAERLLRVVFDIPPDAPVGPAVFLEALPFADLPPEDGLYNEYCRRAPPRDGGDGGGAGPLGGEPGGVLPGTGDGGGAIVDGGEYLRGDANGDGRVDLSDALAITNFLFLGGLRPHCCDAADTNGDGKLDVSDPSWLVGFLFRGSPPPPWPFRIISAGVYGGGCTYIRRTPPCSSSESGSGCSPCPSGF
jgi:hypothetical protein